MKRHSTARRFDEAIEEAQAGIDLDPSYYMFHLALGTGLAGLGKYDEAAETLGHTAVVTSGNPAAQGAHGWALGRAAQRQEAQRLLSDLERRRSQEYVGGVTLALVSEGLGDHDQAISWLELAASERDGVLTYVNHWFMFDPLRSDPRFQALLKKKNFPASAESPSSSA